MNKFNLNQTKRKKEKKVNSAFTFPILLHVQWIWENNESETSFLKNIFSKSMKFSSGNYSKTSQFEFQFSK